MYGKNNSHQSSSEARHEIVPRTVLQHFFQDGNEELRKAIQRNASIRVYILFFLLVMSFSLLFLDWYNE